MIQPYSRSMWRLAQEGRKVLIELVLPTVCRLCNAPITSAAGAAKQDFCRSCELAISISEPMMENHCIRCGMPQSRRNSDSIPPDSPPRVETPPGNLKLDSSENRPPTTQNVTFSQSGPLTSSCPHCRDHVFEFDQVAALWAYQHRVCDAVVAAKYAKEAALGDALGRRLASLVIDRFVDDIPDQVTYVPSHFGRRLSRGGIGTAVIAEAVARSIGRRCRPLLRTTRAIDKQAWLDDQGRLKNVAGAFAIKRRYAFPRSPELPNQHILVVDDVLTTGATADEVVRVLRTGGANRVSLAVVARAIRS